MKIKSNIILGYICWIFTMIGFIQYFRFDERYLLILSVLLYLLGSNSFRKQEIYDLEEKIEEFNGGIK